MHIKDYRLRREPAEKDIRDVEDLLRETGFFNQEEIAIGGELVQERIEKGIASGYYFIFAHDQSGLLQAYLCYGPIPLTQSGFDLYWIAVRPGGQGKGLGKWLMAMAEDEIRALGGTRVYADTSSRQQYLPTREFYKRTGYREAALFEDFYAPGDGKVVFEKLL